MSNSRFSNGLLLGLILGGGAVFLLGTKTGKNILKIISEDGFEGLLAVLQEYELADVEEDGEVYREEPEAAEVHSNGVSEHQTLEHLEQEAPVPKKRFFKRIKR